MQLVTCRHSLVAIVEVNHVEVYYMEKELRHLNRSELIDIIYQLKHSEQDLQAENAHLRELLEQKRIAFSNAGSIADAAVALTGIFETAQKTADIYLSEIERRRSDTERQCAQMIENAQKEAQSIISCAMQDKREQD